MSMEPILFGVAAPAIATGASTVSRAAGTVAQSFSRTLQSASQLLTTEPSAETPSPQQASGSEGPRFALLSKLLAGKSPSGTPSNLTIEDVQSHANNLQADLQQRIQDALAGAGVELEQPLRLKISGADGSLEVDGAHPQRAIIEAALNSDPSLATDFQQLSSERKILDLYARSKTFAKDFAAQPWQAMASQTGRSNERYNATLEVSKNNGQLQLQFD
ncbi:MAG: hypothetical protein GXP26_09660 [Planctomycetes bacterium]|nr:hypothetical protein [Planctomycetota bacterium]